MTVSDNEVTASEKQEATLLGSLLELRHMREVGVLVALLLVGALISLATPYFLTTNNLMGVFRAFSLTAIMSIGMVWVFLFAGQLMRLFTDDGPVIEIGSHYLRIATVIFNSYVLMNISVAILQGLKKPMFAIWIGLYRQLLMPLSVFTLITDVWGFGLPGIWWGIAGINWSSAVISVIFTLHKLRRTGIISSESEIIQQNSGGRSAVTDTAAGRQDS